VYKGVYGGGCEDVVIPGGGTGAIFINSCVCVFVCVCVCVCVYVCVYVCVCVLACVPGPWLTVP
jgi:hypothetical protein